MANIYLSALSKVLHRQQTAKPYSHAIKAGMGGALAIATLVPGTMPNNALLMAPFGVSCVLLFSV